MSSSCEHGQPNSGYNCVACNRKRVTELETAIAALEAAHKANVKQYEYNHATWPMQCAATMCDNSRRALGWEEDDE